MEKQTKTSGKTEMVSATISKTANSSQEVKKAQTKYVDAWFGHINSLIGVAWQLDQEDYKQLVNMQVELKKLVMKASKKVKTIRGDY